MSHSASHQADAGTDEQLVRVQKSENVFVGLLIGEVAERFDQQMGSLAFEHVAPRNMRHNLKLGAESTECAQKEASLLPKTIFLSNWRDSKQNEHFCFRPPSNRVRSRDGLERKQTQVCLTACSNDECSILLFWCGLHKTRQQNAQSVPHFHSKQFQSLEFAADESCQSESKCCHHKLLEGCRGHPVFFASSLIGNIQLRCARN